MWGLGLVWFYVSSPQWEAHVQEGALIWDGSHPRNLGFLEPRNGCYINFPLACRSVHSSPLPWEGQMLLPARKGVGSRRS